jgi:hypothetical protein
VKSSLVDVADVPPGVVTVTSIVPATAAGAVTLIDVEDDTVRVLTVVVPKLTAVAPVKPVPVSVTAVPPASPASAGDTLVTVGIAS